LADNRDVTKVNLNEDFQRSFTHTRPKPTVPPPTGRPSQTQSQSVGSSKPEPPKKS
jgi:hypothetical protein